MKPRLFLFATGWAFGIVAWQTFAYPPAYLLAAALWGTLAAVGSLLCLAASIVVQHRGVVLIAGIACICHALGRAVAIGVQLVYDDRFGLGAPVANYTVAAATWALMSLTLFVSWTHFVIPWSVLRRVDHDGP